MGWHDNWCEHPNGAVGSRTVCEKVPISLLQGKLTKETLATDQAQAIETIVTDQAHATVKKEWTSYGGHQYMLIDSLDTWDNQRSVCEQLGAHMVTINDASEDAFVQSMMPDTGDRKEWLWIGMTKKSFDGWIDGTPMTYSNWAVDQPTTRNNRQRCGEIYTGEEHGMGWHDNWCDHPNGAVGSRTVCEKVPM